MKRVIAVCLVLAGLVVSGCGGGGGGDAIMDTPTTESPFLGGQVLPLQPAPEIGLNTVDDTPVKMADLRGKIVLVTFVYAHCPDICPLIVDAMKAAKLSLGKQGEDIVMVAVSVDPKGDTQAAVNGFLAAHQMKGSLKYVIGTRTELEPIWRSWGVAVEENFDKPAIVEHSGVVWMVDRDGNRAVYFPVSSVRAKDLAHDIKVLLAQG